MRQKLTIVIVAVAVMFAMSVAAAWSFSAGQDSVDSIGSEIEFRQIESSIPFIPLDSMFYNEDNFIKAIEATFDTEAEDGVRGIIVPHHLLASEIIARQIKRASGRPISKVAIIGTQHFGKMPGSFGTTQAEWQTAGRSVFSDQELVQKLRLDLDIDDSVDPFIKEHAIGAIVPFVESYWPEVQILPVLVGPSADLEDANALSEWLVSNMPEDSLVVFSIDFSHFLLRELADIMDTETRQMIEFQDYDGLITLRDDHVDSAANLVTALQYAESLGLSLDIISNSNSDDYSIERTPETTSYFEIALHEDPPLSGEVEALFVGDIMLSRYVGAIIERRGDWAWPFLSIADFTSKADIVFGNLESPISDKGYDVGGIYSFRANPRVLEGLSTAGFNILSLANNHIGNWTLAAADDTTVRLQEAGIAYCGYSHNAASAHRPALIEKNGANYAFLGYTPLLPKSFRATEDSSGVTAWNMEQMVEDIKRAKAGVEIFTADSSKLPETVYPDAVIVSFHFGNEYQTVENDFQRHWAKAAIDAGAKLVIGHHPHVVQPVEEYNGGLIAYSLGNFIFDQSFSKRTMEGLMLHVSMKKGEILEWKEIKTEITRDFQVKIVE